MRISELAPGQTKSLHWTEFDNIWSRLIEPNCKQILELYRSYPDKFFYRGSATAPKRMFRGSSRTDRRPKDSLLMLSELFDLELKNLGMTALRSNSTFVISDYRYAGLFGEVYIVFPVDGFSYTHTSFRDIEIDLGSYGSHWKNSETYIKIKDAWAKESGDNGDYWLEEFTNLRQDLEFNMQKINRLLTKHGYEPIDPLDLVDQARFKRYFELTNTDLNDPLILRNEVMIKGQYYAFSNYYYSSKILEKLNATK